MNIAYPFIQRPIATTLIAIGIAVAGMVAFNILPVAPLPKIDFPTINVQANLPGASPEIMASAVATPLERQLGRIAGVTDLTSSSSLGSTRITVQFDLSRNIDGAARDVQAAINASLSQLPIDLPSLPTYRKVNPADAPIIIIALTSDLLGKGQMYDAASTILQQKLSQVEGVGQVIVGGSSLPAVRVELNPTVLNSYGINLEDVRNAISTTNANQPKGQLTEGTKFSEIISNDQLFKASDYQSLIIRYQNGAAVRLSDVGEVIDSVEDLRNTGLANGKPAVLMILFKQPDANIIETVDRVKNILPTLKASIPKAIDLSVVMDRTTTIRASLHDVEITLIIATCLVIAVVYFFLGNARAAWIPSIAVPLSLLGTFAFMTLFGFSLNNLSLMALTIVTGFVVDDAVVVLENISRHIENGLKPIQAAILGSKEVGFTVLSMSTSLVAVFIPILLMGGIVGRLFREFAITLSTAILMSLIVSLSITPMMCSRLLMPKEPKNNTDKKNNWVLYFRKQYQKTLSYALRHDKFMLVLTGLTVILTIILFIVVPKGFFPQQDTGRIISQIQTEQTMSFQSMQNKLTEYIKIIGEDEAVQHVVGFVGGNSATGGNAGSIYITLKSIDERKISADKIIARLRGKLNPITGATLYMQAAQDLVIGGRLGNAQYQYTLTADTLKDINEWTPRVMEKISKIPGFTDVNSDQRDKGLQMVVEIDHNTASRFGITPQLIDNTLYDAFGQRQVSVIYTLMNQYHVVMEVAPEYWQNPETLNNIYVTSNQGKQVPLATFARFIPSSTLLAVNHQGQFPAATISFNLLPGYSLGEAVIEVNRVMDEMHLPANIIGTFRGTAEAFKSSLSSQPYLILSALLAVYIVLGILYESLIHPITILLTLPSAGVGALLALLITGNDLTIIALIGIILLIGIVKKNAIMMIDFALHLERSKHQSSVASIYKAAILRFRPIMMTTMAAMLGALPLALSTGVGSELRRPLGITIIGGLIVSQMLTLYTTPVIYLGFERWRKWFQNKWQNFTFTKKSFRNVAISVLALFTLSACNVGPNYSEPCVEIPEQFKEASAGWKKAVPQDDCDRGDWWAIFKDPELESLLKEVDVSNQNIKLAEAQYQQAVALLNESRAALFPTLTSNHSVTRQKSAQGVSGNTVTLSPTNTVNVPSSTGSGSLAGSGKPFTTYQSSLNASWELDLWGNVRRAVEASRAGMDASAAQLASIRLSMQATLAQTYFQLQTVDTNQRLLNDTVRDYKKALQLTQNRYKAGVASKLDVLQAETQLQTAEGLAIDNGINRALFEHAIAVLIGKNPSCFSLPTLRSKHPLPLIPTICPSELLERRPDVAAAERLVAQANANIGVAMAAFFPTLNLTGASGYLSNKFERLFTHPTHYWSLGASLAQLIFDGGLRIAMKDAAWALYDQSVATYRQTVLTAFQNVEDNLAAIRILKTETLKLKETVTSAEKSLQIMMNRYKSGIAQYSDVVIAQITLFNARKNYQDTEGRLKVAAVGLVKALGGGWSLCTR